MPGRIKGRIEDYYGTQGLRYDASLSREEMLVREEERSSTDEADEQANMEK